MCFVLQKCIMGAIQWCNKNHIIQYHTANTFPTLLQRTVSDSWFSTVAYISCPVATISNICAFIMEGGKSFVGIIAVRIGVIIATMIGAIMIWVTVSTCICLRIPGDPFWTVSDTFYGEPALIGQCHMFCLEVWWMTFWMMNWIVDFV